MPTKKSSWRSLLTLTSTLIRCSYTLSPSRRLPSIKLNCYTLSFMERCEFSSSGRSLYIEERKTVSPDQECDSKKHETVKGGKTWKDCCHEWYSRMVSLKNQKADTLVIVRRNIFRSELKILFPILKRNTAKIPSDSSSTDIRSIVSSAFTVVVDSMLSKMLYRGMCMFTRSLKQYFLCTLVYLNCSERELPQPSQNLLSNSLVALKYFFPSILRESPLVNLFDSFKYDECIHGLVSLHGFTDNLSEYTASEMLIEYFHPY